MNTTQHSTGTLGRDAVLRGLGTETIKEADMATQKTDRTEAGKDTTKTTKMPTKTPTRTTKGTRTRTGN